MELIELRMFQSLEKLVTRKLLTFYLVLLYSLKEIIWEEFLKKLFLVSQLKWEPPASELWLILVKLLSTKLKLALIKIKLWVSKIFLVIFHIGVLVQTTWVSILEIEHHCQWILLSLIKIKEVSALLEANLPVLEDSVLHLQPQWDKHHLLLLLIFMMLVCLLDQFKEPQFQPWVITQELKLQYQRPIITIFKIIIRCRPQSLKDLET